MPATDVLRTYRDKGYASTSPGNPDNSSGKKDGMDSGEQNQMPRIIKFTDDESKAFAQAKPGEDLACEVHGTLDGEGGFRIMSVAPLAGASAPAGSEQDMAGQVMQKVMPGAM
ncbi:MAG TPA: hypothetical protein VF974_08205 [Patescibacteria group bacterium]